MLSARARACVLVPAFDASECVGREDGMRGRRRVSNEKQMWPAAGWTEGERERGHFHRGGDGGFLFFFSSF